MIRQKISSFAQCRDLLQGTNEQLTNCYVTNNSAFIFSLDYEECAHKMMKMQLKPGQEVSFCTPNHLP